MLIVPMLLISGSVASCHQPSTWLEKILCLEGVCSYKVSSIQIDFIIMYAPVCASNYLYNLLPLSSWILQSKTY